LFHIMRNTNQLYEKHWRVFSGKERERKIDYVD